VTVRDSISRIKSLDDMMLHRDTLNDLAEELKERVAFLDEKIKEMKEKSRGGRA